MRYYKVVFSPTGGTQKAADAFTKNWVDVETLDLSQQKRIYHSFAADDVVLIAMPSFGGLAPQTALDRLADLQGNGAACVVMAVYGNRAYEDTLVQMQDFAAKQGFVIVAGIAAVAQHSMLPQYATARPDEKDNAQLADFSVKVLEKLQSDNRITVKLPGNRPYKKAGSGMVPSVNSACTGCGLCAEKCPVGAIDVKNPRVTDKTKCIGCMRCVSICPHNARALNRMMLGAAALVLKKACSDRKDNELYL